MSVDGKTPLFPKKKGNFLPAFIATRTLSFDIRPYFSFEHFLRNGSMLATPNITQNTINLIFNDFGNQTSIDVSFDEFIGHKLTKFGKHFHIDTSIVKILLQIEDVSDIDFFSR